MPLSITSQTAFSAPSGAPNTRMTVGIGEPITLRASERAQWTIEGAMPASAQGREVNALFLSLGNKTVTARAGTEQTSVRFNVVGPSLRFRKLRDVQVETLWPRQIGVAMELEITLTPLEVSFGGIEFREVGGPASHATGYFIGRAPAHSPTNWTSVGNRNVLALPDTAGWHIIPAELASPLGAGDYQWQIPGEVKVGTTVLRLASCVLQMVQIAPTQTGLPYRGRVTVHKGGQSATRNYT